MPEPTRDERHRAFMARFRRTTAGGFLFGFVSEIKDGPLTRASKCLDIPNEVDAYLNTIFDYFVPKDPPQPPSAAQPQGKK